MNNSVTRYEKELKKKLPCRRSEQNKLLSRFHVMLGSFLEENPAPTAEELHTAFGPPEAMAAVLSDGISPEEKARYQNGMKLRRVIVGVLAALLLLATIYVFFIKQRPITSVDELIPGTEVTSPPNATP
jgi:hypothetical protein